MPLTENSQETVSRLLGKTEASDSRESLGCELSRSHQDRRRNTPTTVFVPIIPASVFRPLNVRPLPTVEPISSTGPVRRPTRPRGHRLGLGALSKPQGTPSGPSEPPPPPPISLIERPPGTASRREPGKSTAVCVICFCTPVGLKPFRTDAGLLDVG